MAISTFTSRHPHRFLEGRRLYDRQAPSARGITTDTSISFVSATGRRGGHLSKSCLFVDCRRSVQMFARDSSDVAFCIQQSVPYTKRRLYSTFHYVLGQVSILFLTGLVSSEFSDRQCWDSSNLSSSRFEDAVSSKIKPTVLCDKEIASTR